MSPGLHVLCEKGLKTTKSEGTMYYRLLDFLARTLFANRLTQMQRMMWGLLVVLAALLVNFILASVAVEGLGEIPGTRMYQHMVFSYFMKNLCAASLVLSGLFLSMEWAIRSGRIPDYRRYSQ